MARGARFALAASNPPPPRGRRQCSGGHTPLYTEGGKSCKKNPRHSLCARLNLIGPLLSFTLFHVSSVFSLFSTPAGNRRRLYLSAGHVVAFRPPCPFFFSLFLSPSCAYLSSSYLVPVFILARLKGTYVCMAACTPLLCGILGASIEREDLSRRCQKRAPSVYGRLCLRVYAHMHARIAHQRRAH